MLAVQGMIICMQVCIYPTPFISPVHLPPRECEVGHMIMPCNPQALLALHSNLLCHGDIAAYLRMKVSAIPRLRIPRRETHHSTVVSARQMKRG